MGKATIFSPSGGAQIVAAGQLYDSGGTLYQRYFNVVYQTSSTTAAVNTHYLCNTTSAAFTMTLPSGAANSIVRFTDDAGTWATNNLTIAPAAAQTIQGIAGNGSLVCNLSGAFVELAWDATNSYWVVIANGFQYGPTYSPGVTGGILPSAGVPGATAGSAVSAGYVGEVLSATNLGQGVNVTTSGLALGSINLTAGNWLLIATVMYSAGASTTNTAWYLATSTTANTGGFAGTRGLDWLESFIINSTNGFAAPITLIKSVNVSTTTTYYINAQTNVASAGASTIEGAAIAVRIA